MSLSTPIEFDANGTQYRFEVLPDPDPEFPRDSENLGIMLYRSSKYILGDEKISFNSFDDYLESAKINPEQVVSLPLYLLDHTQIALSTKDFNDQWDSSCVGVIYTTFDRIKAQYGVDSVDDNLISVATQLMEGEVEDFNSYLQNDIYGFRLCTRQSDGSWKEQESGWNFYGSDVQKNGMLDFLEAEVANALIAHLPSPAPRAAFK